MFKNRSSLRLFLAVCIVHALAFLFFFAQMVSNGLDGSHRESIMDWIPFIVFLATFGLHALPGMRGIWKAAPFLSLLLVIAVTSILVWILSVLGVHFA